MAFEVGDEVVYDGSLGRHNGRVQAVHASGAIDVMTEDSGLIRTDADSLYGRYDPGGPLPAGVPLPFATGGIVTGVAPVLDRCEPTVGGMNVSVPSGSATIETATGDHVVSSVPSQPA